MITIYPAYFKHRDDDVCAWTDGCGREHIMVMGDERVMCVHMSHDNLWWIVACSRDADEYFIDLGPYDTPEIAVVMLRLNATRVDFL